MKKPTAPSARQGSVGGDGQRRSRGTGRAFWRRVVIVVQEGRADRPRAVETAVRLELG
jgi:hypothetical protein